MQFPERNFEFSRWREEMAESSRHGSWTVWGSQGGASLAKLRALENPAPNPISCCSPTTTLSIGMDSLGDSGGSIDETRKKSAPLPIGGPPKRKRSLLNPPEEEFDEEDLVLALGNSPSLRAGLGLQSDSLGSGSTTAESDIQQGLRRFSVGSQSELRLGLSTSVDDPGEFFLALRHAGDEGSSSARWRIGGGLMPNLLQTPSPLIFDEEEDESEGSDADPVARSVSKACKFSGCDKGARGASGLCIAHGGGRRCQKSGCGKGAEGKTVYCKAHGGGRRCQTLGCTKSAEGKTEYCIAHGGGRRCTAEGCGKAARGRSGRCIRHGGGKRCQSEGCSKSAEGYSGLCISHGGGRRCQALGCTKGAQGSTMYCKAHGGGKRCMVEGCGKGAEGSTPLCKAHGGGKRCRYEGGGICPKSVHGGTHFCVAHGGGKRCAVPECSKSARGRTAYCVRHGGGKRCKSEGCSKSAQGSTDFCKAHGGGKRCCWGQRGGPYEQPQQQQQNCERFARGKLGLCAAHSTLVSEEKDGHGLSSELFRGLVSQSSTVTSNNNNNSFQACSSSPVERMSPAVFQAGFQLQVKSLFSPISPPSAPADVPEGRVHNGGLLALLRGSSSS